MSGAIFVSEDRVKRLLKYAKAEGAVPLSSVQGIVLQPEELLALCVVALQGITESDAPLPEGFERPVRCPACGQNKPPA